MASVTSSHALPVFLLDFSVFKPPAELKLNKERAEEQSKRWSTYNESAKDFIVKVVALSGLDADGTFLPPAINPCISKEPSTSIPASLDEARTVMTGALDELLAKTGLRACDIDILVTQTSIFNATPDLASMMVNHYKMRSDVQSYHLGGMGCSAGVVAMAMMRDLLQARPNSVAVFISAEITTFAFYPGKHKAYMVSNAIFRMGAAAVMLSNKPQHARTAKYQLMTNVRVHTGASDDAYNCIHWGPDPDGVNGVFLGRDVATEASKALTVALKAVAPKIMTWSQYAEAAAHMLSARLGLRGAAARAAPYVPDFRATNVDHFVIHAGGYAVLKAVQKGMGLPAHALIPSFAALRDYGNTSSSTTWYAMAYLESVGAVQRGQQIMQVGMGGGVMAGINIWRALPPSPALRCVHPAWAHVAFHPLTEADLPRSIGADEAGAATRAPGRAREAAADGDKADAAAAADGAACHAKHSLYDATEETDEQLAMRAH